MFSRDGDIKELPRGSTVLDFAYHVHTEVGNKCYAARVNQRYVPLTYTLKTGEQVEILTKKDREPNRDWLVNSLGYIKTARARDKLRALQLLARRIAFDDPLTGQRREFFSRRTL